MKRFVVAACAVALVAACGQQEAPAPEAPAAPQSLMDQVASMAPEQQPVFAWQQLTAWQTAHPEAQPPCTSIRRVDAVGVIPEDVDPESLYAGYKGAMVFAVQCGPQLTTVRDDPREQWLVAFAPGATEAAVISCVVAGGRSDCPRVPRLAQAAATP
jgi:hypothetical protein